MAPHTNHQRSGKGEQDHNEAASKRLAVIASQLGSVTSSSVQAMARNPITSPRSSSQREWNHLPSYRQLPFQGGFPGCAWNVWGKGDELGTVNLLTDAVVAKSAKEEIRTGHSISLNWAMHLPLQPFFHRRAVHHEIWGKKGGHYVNWRKQVEEGARSQGRKIEIRTEGDDAEKVPVSDEELHINSQSGTQWDGLRHFGHLTLNCFYQGIPRTDIQSTFGSQHHSHSQYLDSLSSSSQLGIQNWAAHGIVGRAVLLDVYGYLERKMAGADGAPRSPYDPCETNAISLETLKEVARAQGVRFRQGDILLLRMGFIKRYQESREEERKRWSERSKSGQENFTGLEQSEEMVAWLWDHHFAAIASDQPALERWPCPPGQTLLHENLLCFFGMPIGEMFDLEQVCSHAQQTRRWSFYFSSWPMNIYGGVASPANASATF